MKFEDLCLLILAGVIVLIVLWLQYKSFTATRDRIRELVNFFPNINSLSIIKSSFNPSDVESDAALNRFLASPRSRQTAASNDDNAYTADSSENTPAQTVDWTNVELIKADTGSNEFKEVVTETNKYLCKNVGTSADFAILENICNSKLDAIETEIQNSINVPLYLGLGGTFVGIIVGLIGIVFNLNALFGSSSGSETVSNPLQTLLIGVVIAMVASFVGLAFMTWNTAQEYKPALRTCNRAKTKYFDFLRRELMPTLSNSMASSLNSLKSVLGEFIGRFGRNLDAYNNSAELLNDNIAKQHLLLVEINKMNQTQMATTIAESFSQLRDSTEAFGAFHRYQQDLNGTVQQVDKALGRIDDIIKSFDDFSHKLAIVVDNQSVAAELQTQFQAAIERHFPIGSDAREMWRKEFDELTTDAKQVSEELNEQLRSSTEYIKTFTENNKESFTALGKLEDVLKALVQYSNAQSTCYSDLKAEIKTLNENQTHNLKEQARFTADILTAVRVMNDAVKELKLRR